MEGRYDMIMGRDLVTTLRLVIKFSKHIIIGSAVSYEGCLVSMVDINNYNFNTPMDKIIKTE